MVEVVQRTQKIGGSLMVRIPKDVADEMGIHEGDLIFFEPAKKRKSLLGAFPGIGPWVKQDPSVFSKYG